MSKKQKKKAEAPEAPTGSPYDKIPVDEWLWPNRRIDLDYTLVGREEHLELTHRVRDLGLIPPEEFDPDDREWRPEVMAKKWFETGRSSRELAHAWHIARGRGADDSYKSSPYMYGPPDLMTFDLFRAVGYDAWSYELYTNFCSLDEFVRMFVPFVVGCYQWLSRGLARLDAGTSEVQFASLDRSGIVVCKRMFEWAMNHGLGVDSGVLGWAEKSWVGASLWADIHAFMICSGRLVEELNRLRGMELRRSERRMANKMINVITNMHIGKVAGVIDVSYEGSMLPQSGW